MLTAIGNDYGFDKLFARQLQAQSKPVMFSLASALQVTPLISLTRWNWQKNWV
jgi:hypothetical protein